MLAISIASARLSTAAIAYVEGNAHWSRAESDAVIKFVAYLSSGDPRYLQAMKPHLAVPLGDAAARRALDSARPDIEKARQGLAGGGNEPDDIEDIIWLFHALRWHSDFNEALASWTRADELVRQLDALRETAFTHAGPTAAQRSAWLVEVLALHERLAREETSFARFIAHTSASLQGIALILQSITGVALLLLGASLARTWAGAARLGSTRARVLEERLDIALEATRTGLWDWDPQARRYVMSEGLGELLGLPTDAPPDGRLLGRVHPDDRAILRRAARRLWSGRDDRLDARFRFEIRDRYRWLHARGRLHRNAEGIAHFAGGVTDIDAEVAAERELAASLELTRTLFATAGDAILVVDEASRIVTSNEAFASMFGYAPNELDGEPLSRIQPEAARAGHLAGFARYARSGKRILNWRAIKVSALHKSGHEFPIDVSFSEFHVAGARLFAAFLRDITEHEQLQLQSRRARDLLDATQKIARVGGWEQTFDPGESIYWTDQLYRLFELPVASTQVDASSILQYLAPESRQPMQQALAREMSEGVPHDLELVMVTSRGRRFWAHSKSELTMTDGRLVKRTVTVRDITLQKTSQQAQRQAWALQKRTSEQLELALKGAQVALWVFEVPTGRVTHAQRWDMFGYAQVPAHFDAWKALIHPDDLAARMERLDLYFSGQAEHDDAEYRMRTHSGDWVWVRARGQVVSSTARGEPLQYAGVVMDISAHVAARNAIRDQTRFLQAMVDGVDTGVLVSDENAIVYANDSLRRMLGYGEGVTLAGIMVSELFGPEDLGLEMHRRRMLDQGLAVPVALCELRKCGGTTVRAASNTSRVEWMGRAHYILTVTPLTERDMLETQIRATQLRFDRVLISELEAQQAHIARELHDSLGSELAGLSLVLSGARNVISQSQPALATHLDAPMSQVKTSVEMTRALARGLMPVAETRGGLRKALEQLACDHAVVRGVPCELYTQGEVDIVPVGVGNHVYRIAQEALNNAVRHGKARSLELHLSHDARQWRLGVIDDGSGFSLDELTDDQVGLGLRSMMARAKTIGGVVECRRRRRAGTELAVHWSDRREDATDELGRGT